MSRKKKSNDRARTRRKQKRAARTAARSRGRAAAIDPAAFDPGLDAERPEHASRAAAPTPNRWWATSELGLRVGGLLGLVGELPKVEGEHGALVFEASLFHGGYLGGRFEAFPKPPTDEEREALVSELLREPLRSIDVEEARRLLWGVVAFAMGTGTLTDPQAELTGLGQMLPPPSDDGEAWLTDLAKTLPPSMVPSALQTAERIRTTGPGEEIPVFAAQLKTESPLSLRMTLDGAPLEFAYLEQQQAYEWRETKRSVLVETSEDAPPSRAMIRVDNDGEVLLQAVTAMAIRDAVGRISHLADGALELADAAMSLQPRPQREPTGGGGLIIEP